jgi:hypothetical protein
MSRPTIECVIHRKPFPFGGHCPDCFPAGGADERTISRLRDYAEQLSQEGGMATVLIALGTDPVREYVVTPGAYRAYADPVTGVLVQALTQHLETLDREAGNP